MPNIALNSSRHNSGCKMPFEIADGNNAGYASSSKVTFYKMSEEEISKNYGPPITLDKPKNAIPKNVLSCTKEKLVAAFMEANSYNEVMAILGIGRGSLNMLCNKYDINYRNWVLKNK